MASEDIPVEHDGLRFRCRLDGPEGAPWVVFSNSLLTNLTVWDAQVAALAERFRCLRYDQRGHGGTSVPQGACDFDQLGGDLLALLDRFGVATCALVGLSMGVTTGLHLVARHPKRLTKLVFADGQVATAPGGAETWEGRIADARKIGMAGLADVTMERWFGAAFRQAGGDAAVRAAAAAMPLEGYVACGRALQGYDFRHVLSGIAVPTLILAGANDGTMPVSMRAMAQAIPGAIFHVVPDAGHIPNVEQAEIFNRHLLAFLG
jgi:3-oxoadipate enol-lactonase